MAATTSVTVVHRSQHNTIGTMIHAHVDCCGCVDVVESENTLEVVFICNECGKELGRAAIPHAD